MPWEQGHSPGWADGTWSGGDVDSVGIFWLLMVLQSCFVGSDALTCDSGSFRNV